MDALWPELDPEAAGANLRKTLHHARRALDTVSPDGARLISLDADLLSLTADRLWFKVGRFRAALAAARRGGQLEEYRLAVDLYRGSLLPEDRFEEWAVGSRDELHREFLAALEESARLLEARDELGGATRWCGGSSPLSHCERRVTPHLSASASWPGGGENRFASTSTSPSSSSASSGQSRAWRPNGSTRRSGPAKPTSRR